MDSDPEVNLYIEKNPVKSIDEIRKAIETLKKIQGKWKPLGVIYLNISFTK